MLSTNVYTSLAVLYIWERWELTDLGELPEVYYSKIFFHNAIYFCGLMSCFPPISGYLDIQPELTIEKCYNYVMP